MQRVTEVPKRILWPSGFGTTPDVQQVVVEELTKQRGFPFTDVVCKLPRSETPTSELIDAVADLAWAGPDVIASMGLWHRAYPNAAPTLPLNRYRAVAFYEQALVEAHDLRFELSAKYSMLDVEVPTTRIFPQTDEGQREKLAWLDKHGPIREMLWGMGRRQRAEVLRLCYKAAASRYGCPVDWIYPAYGSCGYGQPFHPLVGEGWKWEDRTYKWRLASSRDYTDNPAVWCTWVTDRPKDHGGQVKPLVLDEFFALELPDEVKTVGMYVSKNDVDDVLKALAQMGEQR